MVGRNAPNDLRVTETRLSLDRSLPLEQDVGEMPIMTFGSLKRRHRDDSGGDVGRSSRRRNPHNDLRVTETQAGAVPSARSSGKRQSKFP